jgi:protein SCO1/2
MKRVRQLAASMLYALMLAVVPTMVAAASSAAFDTVRFEPHVGKALPLDAQFRDEGGIDAPLRRFFGGRPVVLVLGYYSCRVLCSAVIGALAQAITDSGLRPGDDVDIVFASIDPHETATDAVAARNRWAPQYPRAHLQRWHYLTGSADSSHTLAAAIGFRYAYDAAQKQYAHAAGIVIATPDGRISNALFGVQYRPQVLRDDVAAAAARRIAAPPVPLLLRCYHYDPHTGRYSLAVGELLRMAGAFTVAALALSLWRLNQMRTRRRIHE